MKRVIKKDKVLVLIGKNRGAIGEVLEFLPKKNRIKVKDVAIVTRHVKARKAGEQSGIIKSESFINMSNVMPICKSCNKATRVGAKVIGEKKVRICIRCKEAM